jgi:hypothetical protein
LALREETQKHAQAIQKANERKASAQETCQLSRNFLAAETKWMKGLEEHGGTCGTPHAVLNQVKEGRAKASQLVNRLCEAAALRSSLSLFDRPDRSEPGEKWPKGDYWLPGELYRLLHGRP